MADIHYDLCVIGGGINGAGIARDAAGRGLSVLLVEAKDLGGGTSSASTKLIHGGLRYLEQRDFGLVRKSLREREVLLAQCKPLVWPISCVLPHSQFIKRPEWMVRAGLFLYDWLGGRSSLPRSRRVSAMHGDLVRPLKSEFKCGYQYSDCWCDDTRLVVMNAVDAVKRGADVVTRAACMGLEMVGGRWVVQLEGGRQVRASMVVNATGPWVRQFLEKVGLDAGDQDLPRARLVKGSHLIVKRQYEGDHAYVLQQPDGRVVFVAPYERHYTLIGTTEEAYNGDPRDCSISDAETSYLLWAYNRYFQGNIDKHDVLFTYSGVRPLLDDGEGNMSKVSRDHLIYHHKRYTLPFVSVFGGKLTTYRLVAEEVVDYLMGVSGRYAPGWTADEPVLRPSSGRAYASWLPEDVLMRYRRSYGCRMDIFLEGKACLADMGMYLGDGVYEAELAYLRDYEWAQCTEDVIWRRSKLGLWISDETVRAIEGYFNGEDLSD